ncbi:MAG: hypothetical protein AAFQ42_02000 [Pseudomonadota bacterium]
MMKTTKLRATSMLSFSVLVFSGALAMATPPAVLLDGAWCSPAGERVEIDGTRVVTPGGRVVEGRLTEHALVLRVPDGERGAGDDLYFEPAGKGQLKVTTIRPVQIEPGAHEDWSRCATTTS